MGTQNKKAVLAFNSKKKLVGVFVSVNAAAKTIGVTRQALKKCCDGLSSTCCSMYWRYLPHEIIIDSDDLGVLTLSDYDTNS